MAANYWASTQYRSWLFTKQKLAQTRAQREREEWSLIQQYQLPERRLLSIFFRDQIAKLGRRLQLRQQAQATAQVYVRRFYLKVEIRQTNPYLVLATALYLAAKMEECPQHVRVVVNEARNSWPDLNAVDTAKIGECEFWLISEMRSQLIVHHPYRTLTELERILSLSADERSLAWSVINDHYLTDLPLLYAPHVVAVAAVFLTVGLKPSTDGGAGAAAGAGGGLKKASTTLATKQTVGSVASGKGKGKGQGKDKDKGTAGPPAPAGAAPPNDKLQRWTAWVAESEVDMDAIVDCTQEMISLYEACEVYNARLCAEQIGRFVKAQQLERSK